MSSSAGSAALLSAHRFVSFVAFSHYCCCRWLLELKKQAVWYVDNYLVSKIVQLRRVWDTSRRHDDDVMVTLNIPWDRDANKTRIIGLSRADTCLLFYKLNTLITTERDYIYSRGMWIRKTSYNPCLLRRSGSGFIEANENVSPWFTIIPWTRCEWEMTIKL